MESTNQPSVTSEHPPATQDLTVVEFLPDADEIERSPLPAFARSTLYFLLLTFITFILWATFSEIDRVVVARGRLITPLPNIVVQPLETSIIESLDVRIGQIVKKGERLATLDPTFTGADQSQLKIRLQSLQTETERLRSELAGNKLKEGLNQDANFDSQLQQQLAVERKANYQAQAKQLTEKIAQLRASIATNSNDQQALLARIKPLQEIESMQDKLVSKQFGARVQMLEAQEKRMEVERDLRLVQNKQQELNRELAALEAEKSAFDKNWRQKTMESLLTAQREYDSVHEELSKAEKRHKMVLLTSPADAVVLNIAQLSLGSVAKGAEPLFTLVPLDSALEAEVQIDSVDVGYVKTGDEARIKLDAYPFQKHGTLSSKVRTISEDAFQRETLEQGSEAYYLSRIELETMQLKNMAPKARLLPGMTLSAEIVVGKRSVMSYLLWPLTKALDESIREP